MTTGVLAPLISADVRVPPLHIWTPPRRSTAGGEVADFGARIGRAPDGEQRLALDCLLSTRAGKWSALTAAIVEARQNGKTAAVLLLAAMADLWLFKRKLVIWTAHLQSTADKTFLDLKQLIEANAELSRRVKSITSGNGNHTVTLIGGCTMQFLARSGKGGRGFAGAETVTLDEALYLQMMHIGALMPTMSTGTNPQMRLAGSAGLVGSEVWRDVRDRGRRGAANPAKGDPTLAYIEWGAERRKCRRKECKHKAGTPGCQMDNRVLWQQANHTMRSELVPDGRIGQEFIAGERETMDPLEFAREILTWWEDGLTDSPVEADDWSELAVRALPGIPLPRVPERAAKVFCVDVSPDSRSAAIVMAARMPNGRIRLEVVKYFEGTVGVVAELLRLKKAHRGRIVLVKASPAAVLIGDLAEAKADPYLMTETEYAAACAVFLRHANPDSPGIEHLDDPLISTALAGAVKKDVGDGMWKWARAKSSDICTVVAATLGPWALANVPGPGNVFAAKA